MSDPSSGGKDDDNSKAAAGGTSKLSFSLGGNKKKKKASSSSSKATATAADFGNVTTTTSSKQQDGGGSSLHGQNQAPLVIPLSQPTQSLLTRIQHESDSHNNEPTKDASGVKQEPVDGVLSSSNNNNNNTQPTEPAPPVVASSDSSIPKNKNNNNRPLMQPKQEGDHSRDQLQRDLEQLPDEADEESYEHVPVSQFGAALLRGMGWKDEDSSHKGGKQPGEAMPRPHRLGLGAIPKANLPDDTTMPSVLSGRRGKKPRKLSVAQLQQQEEFDKKRELQKKQDKQRTLQVGSIVYVNNNNNSSSTQQRAKVIQLQGVPGLNMVSVQLEHDAEPSAIKRGQLGELVPRTELEQRSFVVPERRRRDDDADRRRNDKDRSRDRDRERRRERSSRSPSRERDRDGKRDRKERDGGDGNDGDRRRERSRSRSRDRDSRKRDRKERDRDGEGRRERSRSRSRERDSKKRDRKERDRDGDKRRDEKARKKSRSEKDESDEKQLWMIPNIRVRVVTERLGKRYFRQKGVIIDVTRRHGATLRMDMTDGSSGNSVVLEHVPERYLETALPKSGGQAIVLTGSNKWTKGRLLERNSKTSQGSIQIFEDMSIITLSLDDIAEWCGPLDDDLG